MNLVYMGGEIPSNRLLLLDAGVKHIGVSYWGLVKRGLPKTKDYLLGERYPEDVKIYVDGGTVQADKSNMSKAELEDRAADYEDWLAINYDRIEGAIEFAPQVLGSDWINNQRRTLGFEMGDKYWPVWDGVSHLGLHNLSNEWKNVAISGDVIDTDMALAGRTRAIQATLGTTFHGLACAKPDNLRQVPLSTASTLSWLSPMMRGETIVWDGNRLVRYPKKQKDQARRRYKHIIEKAGLDFDKIVNDDNQEVARLAIWSYQQLELAMDKKNPQLLSDNSGDIDDPGSAETLGLDPDNSGVEVRKDSPKLTLRDPEEITTLPVFAVDSKRVLEKDELGRDVIKDVPVVGSTGYSLRQCNTCFVASNCPAFKPDTTCSFNLPVEVRTKEQLKGLLTAIIEMQATRVAFARFAEELNGGYPDPNTSQEMDRLFKLTKQLKELEENKEFIRITAERQSSGGVMSALFGDKANSLRELHDGGFSEQETSRIISDGLEK